jgi:hypothetical protein
MAVRLLSYAARPGRALIEQTCTLHHTKDNRILDTTTLQERIIQGSLRVAHKFRGSSSSTSRRFLVSPVKAKWWWWGNRNPCPPMSLVGRVGQKLVASHQGHLGVSRRSSPSFLSRRQSKWYETHIPGACVGGIFPASERTRALEQVSEDRAPCCRSAYQRAILGLIDIDRYELTFTTSVTRSEPVRTVLKGIAARICWPF